MFFWGPYDHWRMRWDGRISRVRWLHQCPPGTFPDLPNPYNRTRDEYRAIVPLIPPGLRPVGDLKNYHVVFEADWAKVAPPAPRDPALLKHIGGDLYAVLAVWDLTDLERAVLSRRG